MTYREQKLSRAINIVSKYYGQFTNQDIFRYLARTSTSGPTSTTTPNEPNSDFLPNFNEDDEILSGIMELVLDVSDGAYLTKDIINTIRQQLGYTTETTSTTSTDTQELRDKYKRFVTIVSDVANSSTLPCPEIYQKLQRTTVTRHGDAVTIADQGVAGGGTSDNSLYLIDGRSGVSANINTNPNNPNKNQPNLSVFLSHTSMLSLTNRFTTACSIFLNGMPGIEISRAMPYLDVQIVAARPALLNDKLFAPSIYKYILGGINTNNNNVLRDLQTANSSSSPAIRNLNENYTIMGMEAFLSPQTLAPLNLGDESIRATDVLDKSQPFMSINDFSVDVQSAYSANAFRTAKLSLTIHDRSRMSEIAELFRPDLIMGTQFLIDYGWIHPDGEINGQTNNVYADIINGMRFKEKFRVANWNFGFSDGTVKVDLDLATVGETTFNQELIVNDGVNIGNTTRRISELSDRIGELRRSIFETGTTTGGSGGGSETGATGTSGQSSRRREIRGIQFLDAASNAFGNLTLTPEQNGLMRQFMSYLSNASGIPDVSELRDCLIELYGQPGTGPRAANSRTTSTAITRELRSQISAQLNQKLQSLKKNEDDPFLVNEGLTRYSNGRTSGRVNRGAGQASEGEISLGNLITNFIGLPAAATGQYDEVQVLFYPFNEYSGYASRINIASFRIDVAFFKTKYEEYRLANLSRTGNMTLQQFWSFLIANILDDHGARSYGLFDGQGGLWKDPASRSRQSTTSTTPGATGTTAPDEEEVFDAPTQAARLNCVLNGITPDGSFRIPQLGYYLESVPSKSISEDGESRDGSNNEEKTILRIHISDQAADTRGSLSQILMSERNNALGLIPGNPARSQTGTQTDNYPAVANSAQYYNSMIERANSSGLIEDAGPNAPADRRFRLRGGSRQLKKFLYSVMPSLIYGAHGTLIKNANVTSLQDQAANSINIINSPGRSGEGVDPNGEERGGLPLQVIPVEVSITTMGCPLLTYGSQFYVDFGTGTTLDDIYMINGISHKIGRGEFSTTAKLVPVTGFGTYRNYLSQLREASQALIEIETARNNGTSDATARAANGAAQQRIGEITSGLCNTTTTSRRERGAGHSGPGAAAGGGAGGGIPAGAVGQDVNGNYIDANGNIVAPADNLTVLRIDDERIRAANERVRQAQAGVDADRAAARQRRNDEEVARSVEQREAGWFNIFPPPRSASEEAAFRRARGLPTREEEAANRAHADRRREAGLAIEDIEDPRLRAVASGGRSGERL